MASGDPQTDLFVQQFRSWWPYAAVLVLGAVLGGIGLVVGPGGLVVGVLVSIGVVVWTAWSTAGKQQQVEQLRAWAVSRELTFRERAVVPGTTRLMRAGRYRRLDAGAAGQVAGGRRGVAYYSWTVTRGETDSTLEATLAWAVLPARVGVQRLCLATPIPGRRLQDALGSERLVAVGPPSFRQRFAVEVDDAADDAALQRLFTPELVSWCLDQDDPALWVELEGSLLVVVHAARTADPRVLDLLLARVDHLVTVWGQVEG